MSRADHAFLSAEPHPVSAASMAPIVTRLVAIDIGRSGALALFVGGQLVKLADMPLPRGSLPMIQVWAVRCDSGPPPHDVPAVEAILSKAALGNTTMTYPAIPVSGDLRQLWSDRSKPAAIHDDLGQRVVVMIVPEALPKPARVGLKFKSLRRAT